LALVALDPSTHRLFFESQIEDLLIQILLPTNEFFYTNTTTKFGHFVKYHAARVLIYTGLCDRIGSRVNLFSGNLLLIFTFKRGFLEQYLRKVSSNMRRNKPANSTAEDEFIYDTCFTEDMRQAGTRKAMSVEGILKNILSVSYLVVFSN
jgi:hypothetical protein